MKHKMLQLTKTNSDDQEEIQKATKAATSIIIKVRTVIDKLLEELARQSILKVKKKKNLKCLIILY